MRRAAGPAGRARPGPARSALTVTVAALVGVTVGAASMVRLQDARARTSSPDTGQSPGSAGPSEDGIDTGSATSAGAGADAGSIPPAAPAILLAWSPDGLDPGLAAAALADPAVSHTSIVRGGVLDLVASRDVGGAPVDSLDPGWVIPLDAISLDPTDHAALVSLADREAVAGLGPDQALLGSTSARLRRLGPGDVIDLAWGGSVTVASVVSDAALGGAELAVDHATGGALGVHTDRYLLVRYDGDRAGLEQRLRAALTEDAAVRFRGPGETPFLRNGDAVLPQAHIKDRFGEFAYQPNDGDGDDFTQDATWQAANLVTVELPLLGPARCHRAVVDALAGALDEVVDANLATLVDPAGFAGCWNARTTRAGDSISRHAWGVAVDLNFGDNPTGLSSVQDPRLLAIFARWGFTDGSGWLVPDAGHVEYVSAPAGP